MINEEINKQVSRCVMLLLIVAIKLHRLYFNQLS